MVKELEAPYRKRLPDFTRAAIAITGRNARGKVIETWTGNN